MTPKTRILLGVTGGIAAYKSPDLVRRLIERGAEVQVVMTEAAQRFVTPDDLSGGIRAGPCASICGMKAAEAAMGHIELARWAQLVLIAPASADFIARLAGRPRRRSAGHALPRHRGADRARAGDEPRHVGQQGDAGQRRHPGIARRPHSRTRVGQSGLRRGRRRAHVGAQPAREHACSSRRPTRACWPGSTS